MTTCYPVAEIYGLQSTKALAFDLGLTFESETLNATVSVAEGWLTIDDNLLLEEKISEQHTLRQPTQVVKAFVHRDYYVVHTRIPYETWCTQDCGCVKKGYFGFDDPQGVVVDSTTTSFLKNGGLLVVIILLPLLCIAATFCAVRYRRLKKQTMYREQDKLKGEAADPSKQPGDDFGGPVRAHRPPPTPPSAAGGFGAAEGAGGLSLGNAGRMVLAAHRMAPIPPSAMGGMGAMGGYGAQSMPTSPDAAGICWTGDSPGQAAGAPRNPWAASAQSVLRAQSALALMQRDPAGGGGSPLLPLLGPASQSLPCCGMGGAAGPYPSPGSVQEAPVSPAFSSPGGADCSPLTPAASGGQ